MWNLPPQGILPAQAGLGIHFPESRYQPLPDHAQETADAVQKAIQAITGILQQRRNDQIANQLLAVDNAPKAVAVDGTKPGSGTPDVALTSAMQDRNASLNLPWGDSGIVPDYGGVQGLVAKQLFDKHQQAAADEALKASLIQSKINKNNRVSTSGGGDGTGLPDDHHGRVYREGYGWVTGGQALEIDKAMGTLPGTGNKADGNLDAEMEKKFGITPDQAKSMTNVDLTDDAGRPIVDMSTRSDATLSGKQHKAFISADVPDATGGTRHVMIPRDEFRPFMQRAMNAGSATHRAGDTSAGITKEQYDALPSGATYTAPDGTQRRKP